MSEPVAACYAYSLDLDTNNKNILVYDFGGSTFDASILKMTNHQYEVIGSCGDNYCGGDDID